MLGRHLLARLVAQLEDWLVGWLVVQLVGSLVAWLMGGTASVAQAFLCLWLAWLVGVVGDMMLRWRHDASLVGWLLATPMVLVASANLGVQLASQSINIRTR